MQEKRENNVRLISPCLKAGVLRRDPIKNPAPISEGGLSLAVHNVLIVFCDFVRPGVFVV